MTVKLINQMSQEEIDALGPETIEDMRKSAYRENTMELANELADRLLEESEEIKKVFDKLPEDIQAFAKGSMAAGVIEGINAMLENRQAVMMRIMKDTFKLPLVTSKAQGGDDDA